MSKRNQVEFDEETRFCLDEIGRYLGTENRKETVRRMAGTMLAILQTIQEKKSVQVSFTHRNLMLEK